MQQKLKLLKLLFYSLFILNSSNAQTNLTGTSLYQESLANAAASSFNVLKENSHLYNGSEYKRYGHGMIGHPFFESDEWQGGSVFYDGSLYENIAMFYDLVNDEIIIRDFTQNFPIKLISEKVEYFSLFGHMFIRVREDSTRNSPVNVGFYDQVYNGKVKVLVKREKKIELPRAGDETPSKFIQYEHFFIEKSNTYYDIDNKKALVGLFHDKKNEIRKFLRNSNLSFKKDREDAIVETARYYDQLKD